MYFDNPFSTALLNAATKEKRTSHPHTIQRTISRSPAKIVCPLTPTIDFTPKIPAILAPTEVREVHALVRTMSITNTGSRKKKPEIATLRRLVRNFIQGSCFQLFDSL